MSVLNAVARNLNEKIISGDLDGGGGASSRGVLSRSLTHAREDEHPIIGRMREKNRRLLEGRMVNFDDSENNTKNSVLQISKKAQHSADDCLDKPPQNIANNQKSRSLSTSSYLTTNRQTAQINLINSKTFRESSDNDSFDIINSSNLTDSANIVFIDITDSNKIESPDATLKIENAIKMETNDTDSDKIELDIRSFEDQNKCDSPIIDEEVVVHKPRKPVLRKSKRIVRSDSEIFDENVICGRNEIVLQTNLDIQIHKEPDYFDEPVNCGSVTSSTTNDSRKESSDIDEVCSPRDGHQKSTDDSSRNLSTDELDTVFSDTTDLMQLEREYRELARSNLQREYKSDGDSLDEVGKKRNDFLKWKNQSFENDFELYDESKQAAESIVCSPQSIVESTANSSENSSCKRPPDDRKSFFSRISDNSKSNSIKDSESSTAVTSPNHIPSVDSVNKLDTTTANTRPSKLDITQPTNAQPATITSLFEKRFGKIKKINKLLKCKRFSTSALLDKPKFSDGIRLSEDAETTGPTRNSVLDKLTKCKFSKTNICESKNSIYSSKLSLFNYKGGGKGSSIFSLRKSPMFSNSSHSNTELSETSAVRTRLAEISKSNSEINKFKSSPGRYNSKRSVKDKNNSTACLYKEQRHSPLSEEFYNKTGSVRLSAMELYEKFCSEDFGGLYKHENGGHMTTAAAGDLSCGGFKNWHEYRLSHKGLGTVKKYAKNAKLLRQKSEPKFSFRGGEAGSSGGGSSSGKGDVAGFFPEEEDEDIYEEDDNEVGEYYDDEYGDEYEDEEGDDYEDEEEVEEEEEEEGDIEEEYYDDDEEPEHTNTVDVMVDSYSTEEQNNSESEAKAYHSEIEDRDRTIMMDAADSDVDEIFLMPAGSKCTDYEQYGFENKQFSLEHSLLCRSTGLDRNLDHIGDHIEDNYAQNPPDAREINDFGSDEILTIYKICSKDDILNMKDEKIHKSISADDHINESHFSSFEFAAVNEYLQNASPDLQQIEPSVYKTDCTTSIRIRSAESVELLSSSSGTLRSGSTLTEYAFDTVRNLNLDSCSTSKLSLSLKSEIFDDFTLTPDEPRVVQNCEFEDFTLTPDGSFSEIPIIRKLSFIASSSLEQLEIPSAEPNSLSIESYSENLNETSITSCDVIMIVDKFLANERLHDSQLEDAFEVDKQTEKEEVPNRLTAEPILYLMHKKRTNFFDFDTNAISSSSNDDTTDDKYTIVDLDNDSVQDVVSAFTSELTKEFDLLFSRAEQDRIPTPPPLPPSNIPTTRPNTPASPIFLSPEQRLPSRYSMQKLEPYNIMDDNVVDLKPHQIYTKTTLNHSISATTSEYCKIIDVVAQQHQAASDGSHSSFLHRKVISKLKKNRSQSLGNLSNKTRCFPL